MGKTPPVFFVVISYLLLNLAACQTTPKDEVGTPTNPDKVYRRDMKLKVNDRDYEGTLVADKSDLYMIEVVAQDEIDLLTIQSCHREVLVNNIKEGLFRKKTTAKYLFAPTKGIELDEFCPLQIGGYDKTKGRHSWAYVDFESTNDTLAAQIACNGSEMALKGVGVCQSRAGLRQVLKFNDEVIVAPDKGCELPPQAADRTLSFPITRGTCIYVFQTKNLPKKRLRLTTIGYDDILIRPTN